MTVRWGILSTARIAERVVEGCALVEGAEIVAVASRDSARARAWADAHGVQRAHGSYEALLGDDEVDAVYIPLPNALHVPWSVRALEAGKHVLCEKPLARERSAVEHAFDVAERLDRVFMEGFMWRFLPQTDELVRLLRSGAVGAVRHVHAGFGFALAPDAANVRWDAALEGGALMDVGCYCVSALRLVCDAEPERVSGELVIGGDGVDARFAGLLRFPGDVPASFECGLDMVRHSGLEVIGSEGRLWLKDPWRAIEAGIVLSRGDAEPERLTAPAAQPYALELAEFSAAVEGGPPPRLGRADAVGQASAIEGLYRAAAEGHAVAL